MRKLLIVESPTKAKKIAPMLGSEWQVQASLGHVRDLPKSGMNVDRAGSYAMTYEVVEGKRETVERLRTAARAAGGEVYLATDPDREGESIAWHLEVLLGLHNPHRVEFHEITKAAVLAAVRAPRRIDRALVQAQEARRALDRLVGYDVSSALKRKLGRPLSAGRVQTIGLRLVVDREEQIRAFTSRAHHGVVLTFAGVAPWSAEWSFKALLLEGATLWTDTAFANRVAALRDVRVTDVADKGTKKGPPGAFTTSTLTQAASARLKFGAKKTMQVAQSLFERGLITYHRTDSPNLSDEAVIAIRSWATAHGLALPPAKRVFAAKADAQGAHEGIRPTHVEDEQPEGLNADEAAFYALIRLRAIASQLADAEYDVRTATLDAGALDGKAIVFVARGSTLRKAGWLALTAGDATEDAKDDAEAKNPVPALALGTALRAVDGKRTDKKTEPPGRYTEATLVKALEDRGVGRPSTYASIVETIQARAYVVVEKDRKFRPTALGEEVIGALRGRFAFAEVQFTRDVEQRFDEIAAGRATYLGVVGDVDRGLVAEISAFAPGGDVDAAAAETAGVCPACGKGSVTKRTRRDGSGVFWSCSAYPACSTSWPDAAGKPDFTPRTPRAPVVEGRKCPKCRKAALRLRNGSKGPFWGCAGYPNCKATFEDVNGKPDVEGAKKRKAS